MFALIRTLFAIGARLGFLFPIMMLLGFASANAQQEETFEPRVAILEIEDAQPVPEGQPLTFRITGNNQTRRIITVFLSATGRPANNGPDFTPPVQQVRIGRGTVNREVTVQTRNVIRFNGNSRRRVVVTMTEQDDGVRIARRQATGLVRDRLEQEATFDIADQTADEGDPLRFVITMRGDVRSSDKYWITTENGSAKADQDFEPLRRVILSGERIKRLISSGRNIPITVKSIPNSDIDGDRKFQLHIFRLQGDSAPVLRGHATGTIADDDVRPTFRIYPATRVTEGGKLLFPIRGRNTTSSPISLRVNSAGSSSNDPQFFYHDRITTIQPGEPARPIAVSTILDPAENGQRQVMLSISSPDGRAMTSTAPVSGLVDDKPTTNASPDNPPRFSISDATSIEEGGRLTFNITGRNSSDAPVRLTATATGGSQLEIANPDIMTIEPGANARPVIVDTLCSDNFTGSREITITLISTDLASRLDRRQASGRINPSAQCEDEEISSTAGAETGDQEPQPLDPEPQPLDSETADPIWPIIIAIIAGAVALGGGGWFLIPKPDLDMTIRTGGSEFRATGKDTFAIPTLRTTIGKRFGKAEFPDPLPITSSTTKPPENSA